MAGYLGNIPSAVPLTSADIADGIISSAKIADGTIVNADINASAGIVGSKLSGVANTPIIYARATNATSIPDNTFTKITLDDEIIDTAGVFASSRFTATTAGKYLIIGEVSVNMTNTTGYCATSIYKNGTEIHNSIGKSNTSSANTVTATASIITSLSVSDYIELYGIHNNGSSINTNTGIYTGFLITKLIE